jgi:hypothetical protein
MSPKNRVVNTIIGRDTIEEERPKKVLSTYLSVVV